MMTWLLRMACPRPARSPEPLPDGVAVREASWLTMLAGHLSGMQGPAAAVTLGRTIIVHPDVPLDTRLIRHELAHVRQWQESRLFPVRYVMNHLRYGYTRNPYEVEAREAEGSQAT